jgi:hypothetical protein
VRRSAGEALAAIGRRALPTWVSALSGRTKLASVAPGEFPEHDAVALFLVLGAAAAPADLALALENRHPSERLGALVAAAVAGDGTSVHGEEEDFLRVGSLALEDRDAKVRAAAEAFLAIRGWATACDRATAGGRPLPTGLAATDAEKAEIRRLREHPIEGLRPFAARIEARLRIGPSAPPARGTVPGPARPGAGIVDALRDGRVDEAAAAARAAKAPGGDAAAARREFQETLARRRALPAPQVACAAGALLFLDAGDAQALESLHEAARASLPPAGRGRTPEQDEQAAARRVALFALASRRAAAADRADPRSAVSLLLAGPSVERGVDLQVLGIAARAAAGVADLAKVPAADWVASLEKARATPRAKSFPEWAKQGWQAEAGVHWAAMLLEVLGGAGTAARPVGAAVSPVFASEGDERLRHRTARTLRRIAP